VVTNQQTLTLSMRVRLCPQHIYKVPYMAEIQYTKDKSRLKAIL